MRETSTTTSTYEVQYAPYYEPYVIIHRERLLPYDERFRGYGMNKCIHLRCLAQQPQCTFHVLPGHFLLAARHGKSAAHQSTYGAQSGYRKHVVAGAYRAAVADIEAGRLPVVSATTGGMLPQWLRSNATITSGIM